MSLFLGSLAVLLPESIVFNLVKLFWNADLALEIAKGFWNIY